jgi:hypothetical protein
MQDDIGKICTGAIRQVYRSFTHTRGRTHYAACSCLKCSPDALLGRINIYTICACSYMHFDWKSSSTINLHILTCRRDERMSSCLRIYTDAHPHHQRCIHRTSDIPNIYCRTSDRHEGQCLFVTITNEMMNDKGCIIHTTCVDSIDWTQMHRQHQADNAMI